MKLKSLIIIILAYHQIISVFADDKEGITAIDEANSYQNKVLQYALDHGYKINPKISFAYSKSYANQKDGQRIEVVNMFLKHTKPLSRNEVLFDIPTNWVLNLATIVDDCHDVVPGPHAEDFCELISLSKETLPSILQPFTNEFRLAVYLSMVRKTGNGRFSGYVTNLPTPEMVNINQTFPLLFGDDQDILFLPFSSKIVRTIKHTRISLKKLYDEFIPNWAKKILSHYDLVCAYYLISSRSFNIHFPHLGMELETLVPVADFMNYHPLTRVYARFEKDKVDRFKFYTPYPYHETHGSLYCHYGDLNNVNLLLKYGFILDENNVNGYSMIPIHQYFFLPSDNTVAKDGVEDIWLDFKLGNLQGNNGFVALNHSSCYLDDNDDQVLRRLTLRNHDFDLSFSQGRERAIPLLVDAINLVINSLEYNLRERKSLFLPLIEELYNVELKALRRCVKQLLPTKVSQHHDHDEKKQQEQKNQDEL